jgi:hypothetical protein
MMNESPMIEGEFMKKLSLKPNLNEISEESDKENEGHSQALLFRDAYKR